MPALSTSTVLSAALVLYGQAEFGPDSSNYGKGNERSARASFDDAPDPLLVPETQQDVLEVVRRAVRLSRRVKSAGDFRSP